MLLPSDHPIYILFFVDIVTITNLFFTIHIYHEELHLYISRILRIRELKDGNKSQIPIVAMTANAFEEDKKMALASGMNDHVAKPIDMNVLLPTIMKYM